MGASRVRSSVDAISETGHKIPLMELPNKKYSYQKPLYYVNRSLLVKFPLHSRLNAKKKQSIDGRRC